MNKRIRLLLPIFLLIITSLSCNMPYLDNPLTAYQDGIIQNHTSSSNLNSIPDYTPSLEQTTFIQDNGQPDRFIIRFDRNKNRTETWYYDQSGFNITFENGLQLEKINTGPIQSQDLGKTLFVPENFSAVQSLDDLLTLTGESGFYLETTQNSIIQK